MLVSSQTAVKGGHGFEIAVRMDNLRGWDWGEIQNNAHRVWSMHSRSSLFSVVFLCLISPTQTFKLEKSTLNTKEWGKSRFDEILELWIFILDYFVAPAFCWIPVSQGSILLPLHTNAWQRNLKKGLLIPILHMFACFVSIHSKLSIQCWRLVSLAWLWCYGGSYLFQKCTSLHSRSLRNIFTAAIPGQKLAR